LEFLNDKLLLAQGNLSRDPMASRDAYQKLCGLIADPGSSNHTICWAR